jgi:hypothetical protein
MELVFHEALVELPDHIPLAGLVSAPEHKLDILPHAM